jgi:hypothetical protein
MSALLNQTDAPIAASKGTSDSSHWYSFTDGQWLPLYTPEKNYTLREARKDQAAGKVVVPSVTTIFKVLNKPQLTNWLMEQVAKAALTIPHSPDVSDDDWVDNVVATANNASKGAMDLGTRIHQAIEDCIAGKDYPADLAIYVVPVMAERAKREVRWSVTEACMGSTKYGYAGRCDDHSEEGMVVRDIKSRKSKGKKVPTYETDFAQVAAYGFARFGNDFFKQGSGEIWGISTSEPGLLTVTSKTGPELVADFQCFLALTTVWQHMNNFDPRVKA